MRALIIGPDEKLAIKKVVDYAVSHPWDVTSGTVPGHNPAYVCHVPDGYRCVFTITKTPQKTYKQLSVSVPKQGMFPSPEAMVALADEFGFERRGRGELGDVLDITQCIEKDRWLVRQEENSVQVIQEIL